MSISKEIVEACCLGALLRWIRSQQHPIEVSADAMIHGGAHKVLDEPTNGYRAGVAVITATKIEWLINGDPVSSNYNKEMVLVTMYYIAPGCSSVGKAGIKSYIPEDLETLFNTDVKPL
jgi:hypothetical protein